MGWKEKAGPYGKRKPESESLQEHGLPSRRDFFQPFFIPLFLFRALFP